MWLSFSDAFLSIVEQPGQPEHLLVRSRRPGDIPAVFPGVKPTRTPGRDYLYRAVIARTVVAERVAKHLLEVDYGNFKNSVKDSDLHSAYSRVWSVMAGLQKVRPYATPRRRARGQKALFASSQDESLQREFDRAFPRASRERDYDDYGHLRSWSLPE